VQDILLDLKAEELAQTDTDKIFNKAVSFLPEIKSAEVVVENSDIAIEIAKGAYYPTLSFGAGLGTSYQYNKNFRNPITGETIQPDPFGQQLKDNMGYNLGFNLSVPIFSRFQTKSGVTRASINKEKAELQLVDKKVQLREQIEKAYADATASLDQFISAQTSLVAQEELFKNAQESYDSGVMTSFDFDQVRNQLVNAQSTIANAKYNFVFRTKLLEYFYGIPITMD
jgi:outer membrane protein